MNNEDYCMTCQHPKTEAETCTHPHCECASGSNDLLCVKPSRTIGSVYAPFSLKENPEYVDWCEARIHQLETALRQIQAIQWGYDGDCGAQRIIDSVLDA